MKALLFVLFTTTIVSWAGLAHSQSGLENAAFNIARDTRGGVNNEALPRETGRERPLSSDQLLPNRVSQTPVQTAASDRASSSTSKPMALVFWGFAFATIGGALFVITRRNLVVAVMGMVGTFFAVAALYMMLYATFLAVIQVLVYAGAIMVLFVFVIMILNRPDDEPWAAQALLGKSIAGVAIAYLFYRCAGVLWNVPTSGLAKISPVATQNGYEWGSTAAVGAELFTSYLFPFEAISILLLIAVVGSLAVARGPNPSAAMAPKEEE